MKQMRYVFFTFILFTLSILIFTKDRVPKIPMEQLTNPNSPSYVPIPYPKTREEIIEDLKYTARAFRDPFTKDKFISTQRKIKKPTDLLVNLLEKDPDVKVGKIAKVFNRCHSCDFEFSFSIELTDRKGKHIARAVLNDNGLLGEVTYYSKRLKSEKQAIDILSKVTKKEIRSEDIASIKRFALHGTIFSDFICPLFEIKLKNNEIYYQDNKDEVYSVTKVIPFRKGKDRYSRIASHTTKDNKHIYDTIDDKVFFLKKLK
jgi:hypothetical protein